MTRRSSRRAAALAISWALLGGPAFGEPSAADAESARTLVRQGRELHSLGDVSGAVQRFRAAYALFPTPITGLELGGAYVEAGRLVEAREVLLAAARLPHLADESEKSLAARVNADRLAGELRARIAHVTFRFTREPSGPIVLDGQPLPPAALIVPRAVDPGSHVVVVREPGGEASRTFALAEGETREVAIDLPRAPPPPMPPAERRMPPPRTPYLTYVGVAGAGLFAVTGAITGVATLVDASSLKDDCQGGHCPPAAHGELHTTRTLGAISTVSFVLAAAFGALVVVGLLTARAPAGEPPAAALRF